MQTGGKVVAALRGGALEVGFDGTHFVADHFLEERHLAREMGVEGLFAHAQFGGEIVHGNAAETVREEIGAGAGDDASRRAELAAGWGAGEWGAGEGFGGHNLWKLI